MNRILILLLLIILSTQSYANNITIYTYDSFISEWGPGQIIKKAYEKKYNSNINFIAVDSAATLLNKIILEGSSTKADIVLGLDMNLLDSATKSNLFIKHQISNLNSKLNLPIDWISEEFVPYNYGYFLKHLCYLNTQPHLLVNLN